MKTVIIWVEYFTGYLVHFTFFFYAIFNIFPQNKVLVELWFLSICFIRTLGKLIFLFSVMHSFSPDMKKSFHTFSLFFFYIYLLWITFCFFYFELVFMDYCVFNTPFFFKVANCFYKLEFSFCLHISKS